MSNLPQQGIARIGGTGNTGIRGTGFLVSSRYVMTAAHVVNEAFGRAWNAAERPTEPVRVEFPFGPSTLKAEARVTEWHPPADNTAADVGCFNWIATCRFSITFPPPANRAQVRRSGLGDSPLVRTRAWTRRERSTRYSNSA